MSRPTWPNTPSRDIIERRERKAKESFQRLIDAAQLNPRQISDLQDVFLDLNSTISRAFDTLIAPVVSKNRHPPQDSITAFNEKVGEALEKAEKSAASIVPGGQGAMLAASFILPSQLTFDTVQKQMYVADNYPRHFDRVD